MKKSIIISFLLAAFLLLPDGRVYAQERKDKMATVMGVIKGVYTTSYTNICLISGKDTLARTTSQDSFVFDDVAPGKIKIRISNILYLPQEDVYDVVSGKNIIYITLKQKSQELAESVVSAKTEIIREINDTIIYNAAAVNTLAGDNAIEIFKQLPGASIEDGKFTVFGEEIKRTYVNGILIYGEDPDVSMNSLLAEEVVNMKVYDESDIQDVESGIKNPKKERVLNIITRTAILSAIDAYAIAGYGIDMEEDLNGKIRNRYNGGLTAGYYSEMFQMKAEALAGNVGRTSNDIRDMTAIPVQMPSYRENVYASIKGEKYWKHRRLGNSLKAEYKYDKEYASDVSYGTTRYYQTEENPEMLYTDSLLASNVVQTHAVKLFSNLQQTPLKNIILSANGRISKSTKYRHVYESNTVGHIVNRQKETENSDSYNKNAELLLRWKNPDGKKNLTPSLDIQGKFSDRRFGSLQTDTTESSFIKRILESESIGKSLYLSGKLGLSAVVVNNERFTLRMDNQYNYIYDRHKQLKTTYDLFDTPIPVLNVANTHDYSYDINTHSLITSFSANTSGGLNVIFETDWGLSMQSDTEGFPTPSSFSKIFWYVNPRATISYKSFKLFYNIENEIPSIEQLRNRINDSNILMLIAGNPALKQAKYGIFRLSWTPRLGKQGMIRANVDLRHYWDAIVTKMSYYAENTYLENYDYNVPAGSSLYSFANVGGKLSATGSIAYDVRLDAVKGNVGTELLYRFGIDPQFVGSQLGKMYQHNPMLQVTFSTSPVRWARLFLDAKIGYLSSKNSLNLSLLEQFSQSMRINADVNFLKNAFVKASYSFYNYEYIKSSASDICYHHLNAVLGYRLAAGRLVLGVSALDLLQTTSNYKVVATSNSVQENWTPNTGRYVMFNIYYRFNKVSPKKY